MHMVTALARTLPTLAEDLGQLRGLLAGIVSRGRITEGERLAVALRLARAREHMAEAERAVDAVTRAAADDTVAGRAAALCTGVGGFLDYAERVFRRDGAGFAPEAVFRRGTEAIGTVLALFDAWRRGSGHAWRRGPRRSPPSGARSRGRWPAWAPSSASSSRPSTARCGRRSAGCR